MASKHRECVEEPEYTDSLKKLIPDDQRADEFMTGAIWVLSRNPKVGIQVAPGAGVWFLGQHHFKSIIPLALYYTFDDDTVHLLTLEVVNDRDEEDDTFSA